MSTRSLGAIALFADELKLYWSVLHTALRLDGAWHPNLARRYADAEQEALRLGDRLAGGARRVATLADLRVLSMERIESMQARVTDALGVTSTEDVRLELVRRRIAEVVDIGRLLFRGVDLETCRCTDGRHARRRLVRRLGRDPDEAHLADAAGELAALACLEAERLLAECLTACRTSDYQTLGDFQRIN